MKIRSVKSVFVCLSLVSLLIGPGIVQAQKQKIKVTTEGASIRVKPDAGSEVMATPEVGTVYEVEAKIEDWFEIKLKTDLGVLITGYIHALYVETEKPAAQEVEPAVPKEVKAEPVPAVPTAEPKMGGPFDRSVWPRFEFNIALGYGLAQFEGSSRYAYEWSYDLLEYVSETTNLSQKADNAFFFGGGFSFFFIPAVGIQVGGGFFSSKVPTTGSFTLTHKWTSGSAVYDNSRTWGGSGKLSTIPFYLNIVAKIRTSFVDISMSAGPTIYFNSYEANSYVGFGATEYGYIGPIYYQFVDGFQIPVEIPTTSWTAFGADLGIGFDIKVSRTIAIVLEGRYFLVPKKSLRWEWKPGTYDPLFYPYLVGEFDANDLKTYQDMMTAVNVNPSFFTFSLGFKIGFGQR